ncbi:MerR family transcriptional regulator [Muribacter muris]|uniref:MerR family transcriptional regulator n=1 Tax=Muribacter muris TaxID=67855 RepID=A0A4Y9JTV1_9PAST|nr:MerR family transcriptional regulator [Muribacter muris]MBF0786056.1 MerR family transcriptional regulator [Muribacter muris]MBF0827367.1 MerR family transcriptional regulator [Muribacter muris]TFV08140.1 MerR family transcriptional regulator [Muribacter muris]
MLTFFKKGQLSRITGIHLETIRYYEKIGLLTEPQRAENGYRLFTQAHINELNFIKTCRTLGFSIEEIRQLKALQNVEQSHCADAIVAQHIHTIEQKIQQLTEMKQRLLAISDCQPNEKCKVMAFLKQAET